MSFDAKQFIQELTTNCGVYCMKDKQEQIIYVGKAKNLRNRVASYFNLSQKTTKMNVMVRQIIAIDVTVTHTESEALVLENNLIKRHKPRYNVLFRDDKSYPYIKLTQDEYPRFLYYRGTLNKHGKYFGPYPDGRAARQTLQLIQKLFLVRDCSNSMFKNRLRPCLQYQIKRCSAPCVGYIQAYEYKLDIQNAVNFLEGNNKKMVDTLTKPMNKAAKVLDYEKAAHFRDQIRAVREIQSHYMTNVKSSVLDVIACTIAEQVACVQIFFIRNGLNMGGHCYFPDFLGDHDEADVIAAFMTQFYLDKRMMIPHEILISHQPKDVELIKHELSVHAERQVKIKHNMRSYRSQWMNMAKENALLSVQRKKHSQQQLEACFTELQGLLHINAINHIECFDVSHHQGDQTVAACVVFDQQGKKAKDYRRYNMTNIKQADDYLAMNQAIQRRYRKHHTDKLPDLIIIDGGRGQLKVAQEALQCYQLNIPLLGMAKGRSRKAGHEELILWHTTKEVVHYDKTSKAIHLLQQIRDEAHRFAITAHRRNLRKRHSPIENIEGIGHQRRLSLLQHFGGLQGVMKAGVHDLMQVKGINEALAIRIYHHLK